MYPCGIHIGLRDVKAMGFNSILPGLFLSF